MPVKKKPIASTVDEFIGQGGLPPADIHTESTTAKEKALKLRLDESLLKEIDEIINSKRPSPSRHHWIVSAIVEKLDREKLKAYQSDI